MADYLSEGFDQLIFRSPSMPLIQEFSSTGEPLNLDYYTSGYSVENPTGSTLIQNPNEVSLTIPAKSITLDKLVINKIGINDYISSEGFVSGSTGWRIHGNGDSEFNNVVVRGEIQATTGKIGDWIVTTDGIYYDGTGMPYIKTAATVEAGSTGVIFDANGIRGYDSVLGNVFNLPTDGSAPSFASGTISETVFEINTNAVLRTSSTVGDGTASSAGILINDTGLYACEANQALAAANVKVLVDGSASFTGVVTITSGSGYANISDKPTALSTINSNEGTKLSGIESLADVTSTHTASNTTNVSSIAATSVAGWAHGSDTTKIDGGDIYTGTITASAITVTSLSALSANMGAITAGTIVLPSGGYIRSGQTAYDSGTGFYFGNDGGTPKFSIGNSAANKLIWDGSTLEITGTLNATDGIIGGTSIGTTTLTGGIIVGSTIRSAIIETSDTTPKIRIDTGGIFYQETTATGKYGTNFKYGDGTKYGAGVIAYLFNTNYPPISILREQTKADIRLYNRSSDPASGTHAVGDLICVNGKLKICTTAGSPGTFTVCGAQTA